MRANSVDMTLIGKNHVGESSLASAVGRRPSLVQGHQRATRHSPQPIWSAALDEALDRIPVTCSSQR